MKRLSLHETRVLRVDEQKKSAKPGVLRTLRGTFSVADSVDEDANLNNRLYSEKLLKERIAESPYTKTLLKRNCLFGEADHPENRMSVSIKDVSHRVTDLTYKGGKIVGEIEVLDTPVGRVVDTLIEAGAELGISSRGAGSLKKEGQKERVVEDDYIFYTYDLVLTPGFSSAIVRPVRESLVAPTSKQFISEVCKTIDALDESSLPIVENLLRQANPDFFGPALTRIEERKSQLQETTLSLLEDAHRETAVAESKIEALVSQTTRLKEDIEELSMIREDLESDVHESEVSLAQYRDTLEQQGQRVKKLTEDVEKLVADNRELVAMLHESREKASAEVTRKVDGLYETIGEMRDANDDMVECALNIISVVTERSLDRLRNEISDEPSAEEIFSMFKNLYEGSRARKSPVREIQTAVPSRLSVISSIVEGRESTNDGQTKGVSPETKKETSRLTRLVRGVSNADKA